jgi:hypothetical protein
MRPCATRRFFALNAIAAQLSCKIFGTFGSIASRSGAVKGCASPCHAALTPWASCSPLHRCHTCLWAVVQASATAGTGRGGVREHGCSQEVRTVCMFHGGTSGVSMVPRPKMDTIHNAMVTVKGLFPRREI